MMDLASLSSNWKKLQSTLKSEKKEGNGTNGDAQSNHLKRKSPGTTSSSQNSYAGFERKQRKLRKLEISETNSITLPRRKMGAYVSSLPTASYALQKPQPNPNPTQDAEATAIAPSAPALSTTTPQDPTSLAGKFIAIDCEMVGTHSLTPFSPPAHNNIPGAPPEYSILARVSLVSYSLATIYDAYVLPPSGVTISDYRTQYSGITPWHLTPSNPTTLPKPFATIQREVADLIAGRILIGHALKNDLAVLGLSHPRRDIRDTARHPPFRQLAATVGKDGKLGKGRTPSLKKLAAEVLGWGIQGDEKKGHSSVEDAKATMALFRKEKGGFEREFVKTYGRSAVMGRGGKQGKGVAAVVAGPGNGGGGRRAAELDEDESGDESVESDDEGEGSADETTTAHGGGAQRKKKKGKRKKRTKR